MFNLLQATTNFNTVSKIPSTQDLFKGRYYLKIIKIPKKNINSFCFSEPSVNCMKILTMHL